MPNALGNFIAPDRASIDRDRYENALSRNQVQRLPQANRAQDLAIQGAEQGITAQGQQMASQSAQNARGVLGRQLALIAQHRDPVAAYQAMIQNPQFSALSKAAGVDGSQFTFDPRTDTPDSIRQSAMQAASVFGYQAPEHFTQEPGPDGSMLQRSSRTNEVNQVQPREPREPKASPIAEIDQETLSTAAAVVAANPARIRDYASFGAGGQQIRTQINAAITQRLKESGMTANDLIQLRARAAAQPANLVKLTQQNAQIQQAEQLARANGQRVLDLIDLVDQTGIPLVEGISRSARARAGNVDAAELKSVLNSFQIETARLLSGNPTLAGVISDSARQDIQHIAPDSMSAEQAKRVINRLFTEMDIRAAAAQEQMQGASDQTTVLPQSGGNAPMPDLTKMTVEQLQAIINGG